MLKQRVSDFIADFLAENEITQVFSVVGGGAMHLNNAFGVNKRLSVIYNHHEQASAIAAESYSRITNRPAAVCVTSGPGGTNAITGVLCAYQDSLPMIIISGQVRYDITVESTGLDLRQFGEQEYNIVNSVTPMTKYAVMVSEANMIKYHLEKAIHLATTGRCGPCWIDIPLNIQGQIIETDNLKEYSPDKSVVSNNEIFTTVIQELQFAKQPVVIAGSSLRTSGALGEFYELVKKLKLPIVCPTSTVDIMGVDDEYYYGMFGSFGGRTGNFIVQNADLIVSIGARLSFKQIGFNYEKFSPKSKKIVIDIDENELKKPSIKVDIPICMNVRDFVKGLLRCDISICLEEKEKWFRYCAFLKSKLDFSIPKERISIGVYQFADALFDKINKKAVIVLGNNCAAVSMLQKGIRQRGQQMYGNVNCGTMGYDLPAAIGAAIASEDTVFCITGEGSIQMNIQELQTIVHHNLPIKIVIFNNNSYQAIVNTQTNFFGGVLSGCSNDSGISFPPFEKLAHAYDFPFNSISCSKDIESGINWLFDTPKRAILELVQTETDPIEPKLSSKKRSDGTIESPSIDDLYPFLCESEYEEYKFENFQGDDDRCLLK